LSVNAQIKLIDLDIRKIIETNLVEEDIDSLSFAGDQFTIDIKPFETKTYRVLFE
jgi:hypothetical protein